MKFVGKKKQRACEKATTFKSKASKNPIEE